MSACGSNLVRKDDYFQCVGEYTGSCHDAVHAWKSLYSTGVCADSNDTANKAAAAAADCPSPTCHVVAEESWEAAIASCGSNLSMVGTTIQCAGDYTEECYRAVQGWKHVWSKNGECANSNDPNVAAAANAVCEKPTSTNLLLIVLATGIGLVFCVGLVIAGVCLKRANAKESLRKSTRHTPAGAGKGWKGGWDHPSAGYQKGAKGFGKEGKARISINSATKAKANPKDMRTRISINSVLPSLAEEFTKKLKRKHTLIRTGLSN